MGMNFESLKRSQSQIVKFLNNSSKKNRIVHTYLFEGAKGTYKLDAAYYLANLILCKAEDKPCGVCDNCIRIFNDGFANIYYIEPINDVIKKEQVEDLLHEFSLTSIEEGKRVFIINGVDKATQSAANSLLKFLEESSDDTYGILITENIQNVLSTIRSRSQIISFKSSVKVEIINELIKRGIDEETSRIISSITNNPDNGYEIIQDDIILDIIELVKNIGKNIILKQIDPTIILSIDGANLLKERNKMYHNIFLDLLVTYLNDVLYSIIEQDERITFINSINEIKDDINIDYVSVINMMEKILKAKDRMNFNLNLELLYFQMFIEIAR